MSDLSRACCSWVSASRSERRCHGGPGWQVPSRPCIRRRGERHMRNRQSIGVLVVVIAVAAFTGSVTGVAAEGQQAGTGTAAGAVSRTADGKPDLSGVWQVMNTANWNILPHAASADV